MVILTHVFMTYINDQLVLQMLTGQKNTAKAQPYNLIPNPHTDLITISKLATEWKMCSHDQCLHTLP